MVYTPVSITVIMGKVKQVRGAEPVCEPWSVMPTAATPEPSGALSVIFTVAALPRKLIAWRIQHLIDNKRKYIFGTIMAC